MEQFILTVLPTQFELTDLACFRKRLEQFILTVLPTQFELTDLACFQPATNDCSLIPSDFPRFSRCSIELVPDLRCPLTGDVPAIAAQSVGCHARPPSSIIQESLCSASYCYAINT
ncbi:MAG: hypothetical protein KDJ54_05350 [Candidatus Competibacteraceae bacterium]|nr:hypothetical protein [Candidatus Competibacteraceae bacterium]